MNLKFVEVQKCYNLVQFPQDKRVELHPFCDASVNCYGTCLYLSFISDDQVHCSLVIAKSRVSPTKYVSVSRLELTATVVVVKISIILKQELKMRIDEEYFCSNWQVVLGYIGNDVKGFHTLVANRVQFIKESTETKQWCYVHAAYNSADHASSGRFIGELLHSNWFTGPQFLWKGKLVVVRKIVARIQRLAHGVSTNKALTVEEINSAGLAVMKLVLSDVFQSELQTY